MGFGRRKRNEHNEYKNPPKLSPAQCEEWSALGWASVGASSRAREMRDEGDEEGRRAREKKIDQRAEDEGDRRDGETGELERPAS